MRPAIVPAIILGLLLIACGAPPRNPNYNPATDPTPREDAGWQAAHAAQKALPDKAKARLLFLGDSITAGWCETGRLIWSANLATLGAVNLGLNGDRTEHLLWRIGDGLLDGYDPRLVVLMIGTNNLKSGEVRMGPDRTAAGIGAVITAVRTKLPRTRILLLGILPRQPEHPWIAQTIADTNERISQLADGDRVRYRDLTRTFLDDLGTLRPNLMAKDLLHPNETGYREAAKVIMPSIMQLLQLP
jgi:lysophospholipase L1-like esterase